MVNSRSVSYSKKDAIIKDTIGFIGSGNICEAFVGGVMNLGAAHNYQIMCSDPSNKRLDIM